MRSLTIGQRVILGFVAILVLGVGTSTFTLLRLRRVDAASDRIVKDCLPGLFAISQISSCLKENRALIQHHVLSEGEGLKTKLGGLIATNMAALERLTVQYEATITQPRGRALYDEFRRVRGPFDATFSRVLEQSSKGNAQAAMELLMQDLTPQSEACLKALEVLVAFNREQGDAASLAITHAVGSTRQGTVVSLLLSVVLSLGTTVLLIAGVNRLLARVSRSLVAGAERVAVTAGHLSHDSSSLAEAASVQSASLQETSAAMRESAGMATRNANSARSASELANETRQRAESSREGIVQMQAAVRSIGSAADELRRAMDDMGASSKRIAGVINTISEIAFQTNILALNAAVEAARAGAAGSSFAVVADEVRRLAQRSAAAVQETTAMIEDTIRKSELGVSVTRKVTLALSDVHLKTAATVTSLEDIMERVRKVDQFVAGIAGASSEQSSGLNHVGEAIHQLEEVTVRNTTQADRLRGLAEEMNRESAHLDGALQDLLHLTGRTANPASGPRGGLRERDPAPDLASRSTERAA